VRQATIIYTIGHSDRNADQFLRVLKAYSIKILVDVRASPYSGRFPQFTLGTLRKFVSDNDIEYHWAGKQLGGMRTAQQPDSHPGLSSDSMRGYAEHMQTTLFEKSIIHLLDLAGKAPTAIMCAEKNASQCHRSMISDYLTLKNIVVTHLIDENNSTLHQLSTQVRTDASKLIYDRNVTGTFNFFQ